MANQCTMFYIDERRLFVDGFDIVIVVDLHYNKSFVKEH